MREKGFSLIFVLLLVIIALVVVLVGVAYLQTGPKPAPQSQPPHAAVLSPIQATSSVQIGEIANWKTYTSPCGFSIKYPENFSTKTTETCSLGPYHEDGYVVSPDQGKTLEVSFGVDNSFKYKSLDKEIESFVGQGPKYNLENTSISGFPAVKTKPIELPNIGFDGGLSTDIFILKDGVFFVFTAMGDETTISIWDKMLSTLKFL